MFNRRLALEWQAAAGARALSHFYGERGSPIMFRAVYDTKVESDIALWEHNAEKATQRTIARKWGQ